MEPEVVSLEREVRRAARREFIRMTTRSSWWRAGSRRRRLGTLPLTKADHVKFDSQIRQEPADHTATRGYTPEELRRAVVWREILGPPVSREVGTRRSES